MRKNYIREFRRWVTRNRPVVEVYAAYGMSLDKTLDRLTRAEKFTLPDGGALLPPSAITVLDDEKLLRLPYPLIALEYNTGEDARPTEEPGWETDDCKKRILVVEENMDSLCVRGLWQFSCNGTWQVTPALRVKRSDMVKVTTTGGDNESPIHFQMVYDYPMRDGEINEHNEWDLMQEWNIVLRFLAALACSNVESVVVPIPNIYRNKKSAIPYDQYRELVLSNKKSSTGGESCGDRRSPREHLRRGHIRRLHGTGDRIWINAAVISAGQDGKIHKTYAM